MNIKELIQKAAIEARSQKNLAHELGVHADVISHWKSERAKPDAGKVARLAEIAKLPVLETVAEIEAEIDEKNAEIWKRALHALQSAGVAACITGALLLGTPGKAEAALNETLLCSPNAHMFFNDARSIGSGRRAYHEPCGLSFPSALAIMLAMSLWFIWVAKVSAVKPIAFLSFGSAPSSSSSLTVLS